MARSIESGPRQSKLKLKAIEIASFTPPNQVRERFPRQSGKPNCESAPKTCESGCRIC